MSVGNDSSELRFLKYLITLSGKSLNFFKKAINTLKIWKLAIKDLVI